MLLSNGKSDVPDFILDMISIWCTLRDRTFFDIIHEECFLSYWFSIVSFTVSAETFWIVPNKGLGAKDEGSVILTCAPG